MHPIAASVPRQAWRQLVSRTASSSTLRLSSLARQQFSTATIRTPKKSSSALSGFRSTCSSSSRRSYSSSTPPPPPPPRKKNPNELKFWPFLVVIALGSGGYILLANQRNGELKIPFILFGGLVEKISSVSHCKTCTWDVVWVEKGRESKRVKDKFCNLMWKHHYSFTNMRRSRLCIDTWWLDIRQKGEGEEHKIS